MKPEKKTMKFYSIPPTGLEETFQEGEIEGWNDHYDAVEKWLPSEEEIETILTLTDYGSSIKEKARAIANRLEIK